MVEKSEKGEIIDIREISSLGKITIPKEIRDEKGFKVGQKVRVIVTNSKIVLEKVK